MTGAVRTAEPLLPRLGRGSLAVAVLAALLLGWAVEPYLAMIDTVARGVIVEHDLAADYIVGVFWSLALGATILVWPTTTRDRTLLLALWGVKIVMALGFTLFYESHYTSLDAFGYYQATLDAHYDWSSLSWGDGTANTMGLAWVLARPVVGSYHALKVSFAMIGFTAIYLFYRAAVATIGRDMPKLLMVLVFTPSILFWSSIVGKDPIALFAISLFCYGVARWHRTGNPLYLVWVGIGMGSAAVVRLWLAPIMGASFAVLIAWRARTIVGRSIVIGGCTVALAFAAQLIRERLFNETVTDLLSATAQVSQSWAKGGSGQVIDTPFNSVGSVVSFLPKGIFTALFRPLPGEVNNIFGLLSGLENAVLVLLLGVAISRTRSRDFREPVVMAGLAFVLVWASVYGFLSYQNLGTAVRFRLQVLPLLVLLLIWFSRPRAEHAA